MEAHVQCRSLLLVITAAVGEGCYPQSPQTLCLNPIQTRTKRKTMNGLEQSSEDITNNSWWTPHGETDLNGDPSKWFWCTAVVQTTRLLSKHMNEVIYVRLLSKHVLPLCGTSIRCLDFSTCLHSLKMMHNALAFNSTSTSTQQADKMLWHIAFLFIISLRFEYQR